ncbi:unnamed protein product [Urochloa decumbens]|uniref:F-box protein AT5G49610-like beta-propeller domain-containing protein n=1 Tax=Urochloa decumbens TaxID=240449 RepID=A0ABC9EIV9_9POAL
MMPSPQFAEDETSASKVLMSEGLVGEILQRLHCRICFVSAALTSKHWLCNAANKVVIHNFRSRQLPLLLGIYICNDGSSQPEFMPLPDASCPEVTTALRHGKFGFDGMDMGYLSVWDCRNDRVLYGFGKSFNPILSVAIRTPLRHPGEDTVLLPPQPSTTWRECPHSMLLPDEEDDKISCYRLDIDNKGHIVYAMVFVPQASSWAVHCFALSNLARSPVKILKMTILMRGKIYMLTMAGYILTLHLRKESFSIIDLPKGVEFEYSGNLFLCRGDNSVLYLFHVKGEKLTVWLRRMDDESPTAMWALRDTISLLKTCGHLIIAQGGEPANGEEVVASVVGVGDNADFVFLEFDETFIVYMHLKSRKVKKVYERDPDDDFLIRVLPFMMEWPIIFPN